MVRLKESLDMTFHAILHNLYPDLLLQCRTVLQRLPTDLRHICAEMTYPLSYRYDSGPAWKAMRRSGAIRSAAGAPGSLVTCLSPATMVVSGVAGVEYACRAGYDGRGRVSVTHVVENGYSVMLTQREPDGDGLGESRAAA